MDNHKEFEKAVQTFYLCDRRACDDCNPNCNHTSNVEHAKNFNNENGMYFENDNGILIEKDD